MGVVNSAIGRVFGAGVVVVNCCAWLRSEVPTFEALTLFFESASACEVERRLHEEVYVTQIEVAVG